MRTDRLKAIRESRGLSQQDIADRTGLSVTQISRYERGQSDPTLAAISQIAKILNCSIDYLSGLTDDIQGHITERDLTPMELRLLKAYRNSKGPSQKLKNLLLAITSDEDLMSVDSDEGLAPVNNHKSTLNFPNNDSFRYHARIRTNSASIMRVLLHCFMTLPY